MAFCTKCGAQVSGAFCNQCGTPASSGAAPPITAPGATPAAAPLPPPATARRKTNPIVWVLVGIFAVIVVGFCAVAFTGAYFLHRVAHNPAATLARMAAASNKDLEVVGEDDGAGTVTVRDRRSGKTVTLNFDDAKQGKFRISAEDENGKTGELQFGGNAKVPDWVPVYPGASVQANITGQASDGEGGNVTYTTNDEPSKVVDFFQRKAKDLGMSAKLTSTTSDGAMFVAADDSGDRSLTVVIGRSDGQTGINLTYGRKR